MSDTYTVQVFTPDGDMLDEQHVVPVDGASELHHHLTGYHLGKSIVDKVREDYADRRNSG